MLQIVDGTYIPRTVSSLGISVLPVSQAPPREDLPPSSSVDVTYIPPTVYSLGISVLPASQAPPREDPPPSPSVEVVEKVKPKKHHRPRAVKMTMQQAHYALVLEAAHAVIKILNKNNFPCAVFGSLAAKLYGSSRCPKDVDLLVSQELAGSSSSAPSSSETDPLTAAELKDLILHSDSQHFYLKLPRDRSAEYRILWYRQHYRGPECKVDILVPGTMSLPHLPRRRVVFLAPRAEAGGEGATEGEKRNGASIPVVPFALLLAHKLKGWDDHRSAEEPFQQQKQHQDAGDVRRLLGLRREVQALVDERKAGRSVWADAELFSEEFQDLTKGRVKAYCEEFPDRAEEWRKLGFETS